MELFMTEDFLLRTPTARILYHEYAATLPIYDYHCHLPVAHICQDHRFDNLTQIWLQGDHYKWRAMRAHGVDERYCTGDASDEEKFFQWAKTLPATLRNPLYHWSHLELKRYFGVNDLLTESSARRIYQQCNERLRTAAYSARNLLRQINVKVLCTTEDPIDTLRYHQKLREDGFEVRVLPVWRPDMSMAIENLPAWNRWVDTLAAVCHTDINNYAAFLMALRERQNYFHQHGCLLSDHALEKAYAEDYTDHEIKGLFLRLRAKQPLSQTEHLQFKSALLYELALMNAEKGWVQQFHLGALRNVNTKMYQALGADSGFDSMNDESLIRPLARLLDRLEQKGRLAKTIVFNLNPRDSEALATLIGSFHDGQVPGKMQYGPAWWFLDQKDGIEQHLRIVSNLGLLGRFVGMVTDSRSFLSFPRHEYFRRILCNLLGTEVEQGLLPWDKGLLGTMIQNICYYNARHYFDITPHLNPNSQASTAKVPR